MNQEFETLFQRLLVDPSDRQANLRFVEVAIALGDDEAAIGALDRLLFYEPENAELHFQVGELYLKVGSYVAAQSYFETVLELPTATPQLRQAATARLAEIERQTRPSPWSVFLQAGLRYQTNATAAPAGLAGVEPDALEQPDWNSFALGVINFRQPVGKHVLEAGLTGYYADQFDVDRLDLGLLELVAGPRFTVASSEASTLSVKPYGVVNGVLLADSLYQRTLGAGLSGQLRLGDPLTIEPYVEYRDRNYFETEEYPTAPEQTGHLVTYAVAANGAIGERVSWTSRFGLSQNDAREGTDSFDEYFADLSLRLQFGALGETSRTVSLTPFFGVNWADYSEPEPDAEDPEEIREDFEWRAGARLEVPIYQALGIGLQMQYIERSSNIERFEYDNLQVTAGPTVRF